MNVQFGTLISSESTCSLNSFTLSIEMPRYFVRTCLAYRPLPVPRNDMLAFVTHLSSLGSPWLCR